MGRKAACLLLAATAFALTGQRAPGEVSSQGIVATLPRIVKIFGTGGVRGLPAYGTGFMVSPQGHIATTWSATLMESDEVTVILDDGRRLTARVKGWEPHLDLAVLELTGDNPPVDVPHFDLSQALDLSPGARVLAFSNMYKVATGNEPVSVIHGVIAAQTRLTARRGVFESPYDGPVYVVDAITNTSGAAGGVLTTLDGRLVGMIGKEHRNAKSNTWINYAIPVSQLKDAVQQIVTGQFVREADEQDKPENPLRYQPLDFGMILVPDVVPRTPAYIDGVQAGSAAERAGLRSDDLILFANDELVTSCRMLKNLCGWLEPGDTLKLVIRRGDTLVPLELPVERK